MGRRHILKAGRGILTEREGYTEGKGGLHSGDRCTLMNVDSCTQVFMGTLENVEGGFINY